MQLTIARQPFNRPQHETNPNFVEPWIGFVTLILTRVGSTGRGIGLCDEGKQVVEQPICPFILGEVLLGACPTHQALGTLVIVGR
jgi:hypothetical protein